MQYVAMVWATMGLLFLAMLGMALIGHRYGRRQLARRGDSAATGTESSKERCSPSWAS